MDPASSKVSIVALQRVAFIYFCALTSAFGTCIQKYVIERCLSHFFMVIAQTHIQAVATVDIGPHSRYYVDMCPLSRHGVDMCPLSRYCVDICLHSNYCSDRFCWFLAVSLINTLTHMV